MFFTVSKTLFRLQTSKAAVAKKARLPLGLRLAIGPSLEAELLVKPSEDSGWFGVELS